MRLLNKNFHSSAMDPSIIISSDKEHRKYKDKTLTLINVKLGGGEPFSQKLHINWSRKRRN